MCRCFCDAERLVRYYLDDLTSASDLFLFPTTI